MFILWCWTGSLPSGRTTLLLAEGWSGRLQDHLRPHQSCPIGRLQDQLRPHQSCPMSHAQNHACWHLCAAYGWGSAHPRDFSFYPGLSGAGRRSVQLLRLFNNSVFPLQDRFWLTIVTMWYLGRTIRIMGLWTFVLKVWVVCAIPCFSIQPQDAGDAMTFLVGIMNFAVDNMVLKI